MVSFGNGGGFGQNNNNNNNNNMNNVINASINLCQDILENKMNYENNEERIVAKTIYNSISANTIERTKIGNVFKNFIINCANNNTSGVTKDDVINWCKKFITDNWTAIGRAVMEKSNSNNSFGGGGNSFGNSGGSSWGGGSNNSSSSNFGERASMNDLIDGVHSSGSKDTNNSFNSIFNDDDKAIKKQIIIENVNKGDFYSQRVVMTQTEPKIDIFSGCNFFKVEQYSKNNDMFNDGKTVHTFVVDYVRSEMSDLQIYNDIRKHINPEVVDEHYAVIVRYNQLMHLGIGTNRFKTVRGVIRDTIDNKDNSVIEVLSVIENLIHKEHRIFERLIIDHVNFLLKNNLISYRKNTSIVLKTIDDIKEYLENPPKVLADNIRSFPTAFKNIVNRAIQYVFIESCVVDIDDNNFGDVIKSQAVKFVDEHGRTEYDYGTYINDPDRIKSIMNSMVENDTVLRLPKTIIYTNIITEDALTEIGNDVRVYVQEWNNPKMNFVRYTCDLTINDGGLDNVIYFVSPQDSDKVGKANIGTTYKTSSEDNIYIVLY